MTTVHIDLPDQCVQHARSAGLLTPQKLEALLRAQLRRESFDGLRALHDRLPAEELGTEAEQEIVDTVREARRQYRQRNSS
jgi:hypothetical protein